MIDIILPLIGLITQQIVGYSMLDINKLARYSRLIIAPESESKLTLQSSGYENRSYL